MQSSSIAASPLPLHLVSPGVSVRVLGITVMILHSPDRLGKGEHDKREPFDHLVSASARQLLQNSRNILTIARTNAIILPRAHTVRLIRFKIMNLGPIVVRYQSLGGRESVTVLGLR